MNRSIRGEVVIAVKEIRFHGRGGQGTIKASEILVWAAVRMGKYAHAIPYFGFERAGAPVSAFVRLDDRPIRQKTQIYRPDCLVVMDATLNNAVPVFDGVKDGSVLVVNCGDPSSVMAFPPEIAAVAYVDATEISGEVLGRHVPNTTMLGAFARATGWVKVEDLAERAAEVFGEANHWAVERGYEEAKVMDLR